jgi:hypothetical protein
MRIVKESERFELIKKIHRQAPPGTEYGVSAWNVSWLIREIERLREENEKLREERDTSDARIVELHYQKAKLVECLEWYGAKNHLSAHWQEDGQRARDILTRYKDDK